MRYGGRLEAIMTWPAGRGIDVTTTGDPVTVFVTAGTYTPTEFCAHLQARLIAEIPGAWTVTLSVGRSGSGLVTITYASAFSIHWTSTVIRDALGFTEDLAGVMAATGTSQAAGLWFPDCPAFFANSDPLRAPRETDGRIAVSPTRSSVIGYIGNSYRAHREVKYSHIPRSRMFEGEAVTPGSSFIHWLEDTQWNEGLSCFTPFSPFKFYCELGGVDVAVGADLNAGDGPAGGWYFNPPIINEQSIQNAVSPTLGFWSLTIAGIESAG